MLLSDFLPKVAKRTQIRFQSVFYKMLQDTECKIYDEVYLIIYEKGGIADYFLSMDIRDVISAVREYEKDCQIFRLDVQTEAIVEQIG